MIEMQKAGSQVVFKRATHIFKVQTIRVKDQKEITRIYIPTSF